MLMLVLASVGIFTARYSMPMCRDQPADFLLVSHHRPIMILAISAAIAAFVLIFVQVRAWTATPVSVNPHPIIGIIAFGLGLIQPIMAIFRPHPGTANPYFQLGTPFVAAIFLGIMIAADERIRRQGLRGGFLDHGGLRAFHVLWLICSNMIDWIAPLVGGGKFFWSANHYHADEDSDGHGTVYEETVIQEPVKAPASTLKTILWFTHFIVVAGLTIAISCSHRDQHVVPVDVSDTKWLPQQRPRRASKLAEKDRRRRQKEEEQEDAARVDVREEVDDKALTHFKSPARGERNQSENSANRFVGYLEEEAVKTYTALLQHIAEEEFQSGPDRPPRTLRRSTGNYLEGATYYEMFAAIRADEAHHRLVNHTLSSMQPDKYNPSNQAIKQRRNKLILVLMIMSLT
ncbi:hypothetical protein BV898_17107 [Hypsibius exemplaris]|uniref:Cytochrome b561 domain-containing protein n=1 Tax=Hypsibius exemplaris TaxID=2072580 RepID=A0A9X6NEZ3_HYPEX|nr:hypothetical protein BV898_17107 [Hypsibius exemplaris]